MIYVSMDGLFEEWKGRRDGGRAGRMMHVPVTGRWMTSLT